MCWNVIINLRNEDSPSVQRTSIVCSNSTSDSSVMSITVEARLFFLFRAQVTRHNDAPFSLLQVCAEFGLPLLQSYLTRHVITHLTLETVCQTLVGASSLMKSSRDDSLRLALKQIAQESNAYIIGHARAIFKGRGYLDLPKDTFASIISSNEVR